MDASKLKTIIRILAIVGLVSFLFPFIVNTVVGEDVTRVSGIKVMTRFISDGGNLEGYNLASFILFWTFISGVMAVIASWFKDCGQKKKQLCLQATALCAVGMFVFCFMVTKTHNELDYFDVITLSFGFGWWIAVITYIGASAALVYLWKLSKASE